MKHQDRVSAVAFSPDGKMILTGSWDKTARLWDTATGKPVGPPMRHEDRVEGVAFSPDGGALVTGCWDKTARLWRAPGPVADDGERVTLWTQALTGLELRTGERIWVLNAAAWHERGRRLANLGGLSRP